MVGPSAVRVALDTTVDHRARLGELEQHVPDRVEAAVVGVEVCRGEPGSEQQVLPFAAGGLERRESEAVSGQGGR